MSKANLLLVDDDTLVLQSLSLSLEDEGYSVATAASGKEAIALCRQQTFEVVICDIRMPEMNGIETLSAIKEIYPDVRTIVITGFADDPETPVQAVRLGVDDYLLKPFDDELLHHSVAQNIERFRLQKDNARLYAELQEANARPPGKHPTAPRSSPALPLFGVIPHYPGLHSPTGKKGLFEEADGGTLFLDEVGEMGTAMQVKLLRVLQDGEIQRVGDTQHRRVDVRLVAATNRDLEKEVEEGRFRQDLYYRLAGIEIHVPPLRQRRGDVPLLVQHFLQTCCAKLEREVPNLNSEVSALLEQYHWPGNVRELQKEVERALTLAGRETLALQHFSNRLKETPSRLPADTGSTITLDELERRHIHGVLQKVEWNIQQAAAMLGIHRNTLASKIAEYDLRQEQ